MYSCYSRGSGTGMGLCRTSARESMGKCSQTQIAWYSETVADDQRGLLRRRDLSNAPAGCRRRRRPGWSRCARDASTSHLLALAWHWALIKVQHTVTSLSPPVTSRRATGHGTNTARHGWAEVRVRSVFQEFQTQSLPSHLHSRRPDRQLSRHNRYHIARLT